MGSWGEQRKLDFFFFQKQISGLNLWFYGFLFLFYFLIYIHLWLLWVFVAAQAFSGCGKEGLLSVVVRGPLMRWLLLLGSTGSGHTGSSSCAWALVALQYVGSSQTRNQTRVPWAGRRILIYCTTREVLDHCFWIKSKHWWKYFMSALLHPHHLLFPFKSGLCGCS